MQNGCKNYGMAQNCWSPKLGSKSLNIFFINNNLTIIMYKKTTKKTKTKTQYKRVFYLYLMGLNLKNTANNFWPEYFVHVWD